MVLASKFTNVLPQDPRAAQANAELQAQQYQQQLAARQSVYSAPVQPGVAFEDRLLNPDGSGKNAVLNTTAATPLQGVSPADQLTKRLEGIDRGVAASAARGVTYNAEAMKQTEIAKFNAEQQANFLAQQQAAATAARQSAGAIATTRSAAKNAPTTNVVSNGPAISARQTPEQRQAFIEQKRAEGMTDDQIRKLLSQMPPASVSPTGTSQPSTPPAGDGSSGGGPNATGTNADTSGGPPQSTQTKQGDTAAPQGSPGSNLLRSIAMSEADPIMQALLLAEADTIDANPMPGDAMTQDQFMQGGDAKAISQPYDAIQSILDKASARAEKYKDSVQSFLTQQLDRNDKFNAEREENIKNQLQFHQDQAVREQMDANKKLLDSQTIMLALQGGFGSEDGNREIADARLKGEEAITNLKKEFGFKMADVSLEFTQMHNEAFDKYQMAWLDATEQFENKVSNLDIQGVSNQQAKGAALRSAYKEYADNIKQARKDHAEAVTKATEQVYNAMTAERNRKEDIKNNLWAKMMQHRQIDGDLAPGITRQIVQEMQAAGMSVTEDMFTGKTVAQVNEEFRRQWDKDQAAESRRRWETEQTAQSRGKPLLASQLKSVTEYDDSLGLLGSVRSSILNGFKDVGGPLSGRVGMIPGTELLPGPAGENAMRIKQFEAQAALVKQIIGKALEGGVLRKEDEAKYENIIPNIRDTDAIRATKLDNLEVQIKAKKQNLIDNLSINGYDTTGFMENTDPLSKPTAPQIPNADADALMDAILNGGPITALPPKTSGIDPSKDLASATIGNRTVKAQPYLLSALRRADADMFSQTGQHIAINQDYRDSATQAKLYEELSKKGARVAPPGKSFHEKGLAVDVTNWKEAAPYLAKYGVVNGLKDDMGHFSIGEMNPDYLASLSTRA